MRLLHIHSARSVQARHRDSPPAYALMGLDGGYGVELNQFKVNAFLRINNLLNRRYVGSVIVDDGNGRYFEPGPGFNILGGFSVTMK